MERCRAVVLWLVECATGLDEDINDLEEASTSSEMERGRADVVLVLRVGAKLEEATDGVLVTVCRGIMQWRVSLTTV